MRAISTRSLAFFTEALGFRVIDDNAPLWFLHCDNTDHCSIVLAKTNLPTLNHVAFDMPDFDSVMRGMGRMKDNGYPIEWGPGRHGPGDNVFAYFCGPDEVPLEYAAEVLQVDDSYQPRPSSYWKFAPGRSDQWGITQPRSARYYRVQRLFGFTADGDRVTERDKAAQRRSSLRPRNGPIQRASVTDAIRRRGRETSVRRSFLLSTATLARVGRAGIRRRRAGLWPTRPIRALTTTSAGGISDVFMRALGEKLGAEPRPADRGREPARRHAECRRAGLPGFGARRLHDLHHQCRSDDLQPVPDQGACRSIR